MAQSSALDNRNFFEKYGQHDNLGKISEKRHQSNALKDIKKKLSFVNKRINELQHQRRFAYKNSVKVKRTVHCQINQLVKCLRARERSLLCDVDEAYVSQDSSISDELSRLQSVYGRCQTLYSHLDDFKGNVDVLTKMYVTLAEINIVEKPSVKPVEFISDFELFKSNANTYGHLEGDFIKKDHFMFIVDKHDNDLPDMISKQFQEKVNCFDEYCKTTPQANLEIEASKKHVPTLKRTASEDSFEVIDGVENVQCQDIDKNSPLAERDVPTNYFSQSENFAVRYTFEDEKKCVTNIENPENYVETSGYNKYIDIGGDWKQITEMKMKNTGSCILPKQTSGKEVQCQVQQILDHLKATQELFSNCQEKKKLKETDSWLQSSLSGNDSMLIDKNYENGSSGINVASPADVIRQAFIPYLMTKNTQEWLS